MRIKRLILLAALIPLVSLWGCSSSMDSAGGGGGGGGDGVAEVGSTSCSTCHSGGSTYVSTVYDLWLVTTHGNQDGRPSGHDPVADPGDSCVPCHAGPDMDYVTYGNAIGCERCHGGGGVHLGVGPLPEPQPGPDVCLECHGLTEILRHGDDSDRQIYDTHYDDPTTSYYNVDDDEYFSLLEGYIVRTGENSGCYECHDAHNTDLTINREWGRSPHAAYILDVKDAVGLDEEDVDPDERRYDAVLAESENPDPALPDSGFADAFIHGGWSGSCQRCHTSTGGSNFLDDPYGYDSDDNDWSHFATGAQDGRQDELIYCWACHINGSGVMRLPPLEDLPIYDRNNDISGEIDVADAGNSIVCVGCHGGRANGEYVRNTAAGSRSGSGRVHYRASAGTLYAADIHTGYEFDLDLGDGEDPDYYYDNDDLEHHEINEGTGESGPCASCHMYDTSHTYAVVEKDVLGDYTAINSLDLCNSCHDPDMSVGTLQTLSDGYQDALQYLSDLARGENGIFNYTVDGDCETEIDGDDLVTNGTAVVTSDDAEFQSVDLEPGDSFTILTGADAAGSPYTIASVDSDNQITLTAVLTGSESDIEYEATFDSDCDFGTSGHLRQRGDDVAGKNDYGAWQNYNYLNAEPGAFAHNSIYARRILYDSIDWLQDGDVGDATITIPGGYPAAEAWFGGNPVSRP